MHARIFKMILANPNRVMIALIVKASLVNGQIKEAD